MLNLMSIVNFDKKWYFCYSRRGFLQRSFFYIHQYLWHQTRPTKQNKNMREQERNKMHISLFHLPTFKKCSPTSAQLKNSENWIFCILNHISPLCTAFAKTCNSHVKNSFFAETTKSWIIVCFMFIRAFAFAK